MAANAPQMDLSNARAINSCSICKPAVKKETKATRSKPTPCAKMKETLKSDFEKSGGRCFSGSCDSYGSCVISGHAGAGQKWKKCY